ncbi:hypothetical protein RH915_02975 [Serpentinicella sp. ANB-PHB4]|uniref:hypothetical protein n=1 Tax=Serpentinicella sp. ANB-PHB4 TaxID=3074076 RepID=UPI002867864F|nr:hypothetical protein [Serpentinicella sp. ANB-PHB4]MDR5658445.1 hypothetical protein [Serpentinicella sp. ANB-PHB4]
MSTIRFNDYDNEEDYYDRLKSLKNQDKHQFTNKSTFEKFEFDYEEDPYEP